MAQSAPLRASEGQSSHNATFDFYIHLDRSDDLPFEEGVKFAKNAVSFLGWLSEASKRPGSEAWKVGKFGPDDGLRYSFVRQLALIERQTGLGNEETYAPLVLAGFLQPPKAFQIIRVDKGSWIVVAQVASQLAPHVLDCVMGYLMPLSVATFAGITSLLSIRKQLLDIHNAKLMIELNKDNIKRKEFVDRKTLLEIRQLEIELGGGTESPSTDESVRVMNELRSRLMELQTYVSPEIFANAPAGNRNEVRGNGTPPAQALMSSTFRSTGFRVSEVLVTPKGADSHRFEI